MEWRNQGLGMYANQWNVPVEWKQIKRCMSKPSSSRRVPSSRRLELLPGAPKDKRVVKEDLWCGKGSPYIEMDEEASLVNRERAVDYLNSLEKVFVNDQFLNWDPENRIISARAYHSLFMHNMCIRPPPEELEDFGTPDFTAG